MGEGVRHRRTPSPQNLKISFNNSFIICLCACGYAEQAR